MKSDFQKLASTWEQLGERDPLWAVVSHSDKRGGRWNLSEFMQTGERDIAHYHAVICRHAPRAELQHVLDFGCGAGRLTAAWGRRAKRATGVDISGPMVELARKNLAEQSNLTFVLNKRNDLGDFEANSFDLVFSLICLQHMPWSLASAYIPEFSRVCCSGGIVAFQVPARAAKTDWLARSRKALVDALPFGLDRAYRRWRHGSSVAFEMHFTPSSLVENVATQAGLKLIHREPDASAGPGTEGFFYIFEKSRK